MHNYPDSVNPGDSHAPWNDEGSEPKWFVFKQIHSIAIKAETLEEAQDILAFKFRGKGEELDYESMKFEVEE